MATAATISSDRACPACAGTLAWCGECGNTRVAAGDNPWEFTPALARAIVHLADDGRRSEDICDVITAARSYLTARDEPSCGRCDGYGGWWAAQLDDGADWEIRPDSESDGVGYVICPCTTAGT